MRRTFARTRALLRRPSAKDRRGSSLMLTLVLTFALGGLATSAIYLSSNTTILSKLYDRERDYRYAAEWALAYGKSQLGKDTSLVLPDSLMLTLLSNAPVPHAGGGSVPLARVDLYAGLSGAVNGQYGRAVSLVAVVSDASGARHARRLELLAENFARYAVFTDRWTAGLCYTTGEIVRGRAHSNQNWVSCGPPGPVYTDTVSAVGTISGSATYQSGNRPSFPAIRFPTVATLSRLPSLASAASFSITAKTLATGGTRIEFVTVDVDGNGTISVDEGFFKVFNGVDSARTKAYFPYNVRIDQDTLDPVIQNQCGATYAYRAGRQWFIPVRAHNDTWFRDSLVASGLYSLATANSIVSERVLDILAKPTARCYPAGDPHLAPAERVGPTALTGGEDTTFTANVTTGSWVPFPGTPVTSVGPFRQIAEAPYLWPLHRAHNPNTQGVIYVNGNVYASGVLRGRVTLYASGSVFFIDDLTYTVDPSTLPICQNLLGVITGVHAVLADNIIQRPRTRVSGSVRFFDGDADGFGRDFHLHGVTLSGVSNTSGTFLTEQYNRGPSANRLCAVTGSTTAQTSGGCINQAGGVIERTISATFAGGWTGFAENRVKDQCLDFDSPPYFPLTGRYIDNEFYELDPVKITTFADIQNLYRQLQGATP